MPTTTRSRRNSNTTKKMLSFSSSRSRLPLFPLLLVLALVLLMMTTRHTVLGAVSCTSNEYCRQQYNSNNTVCIPSTLTCSNPYESGCLKAILGENHWPDKRVCNSDDYKDRPENYSFFCQSNEWFQDIYPELRIHQGNWETSILLAWLYQVILMEILHVPITVGYTSNSTNITSFYSTNPTFEYSPEGYYYDALLPVSINPLQQDLYSDDEDIDYDCSKTTEPCIHIMPEVWPGAKTEYEPYIQQHHLESPTPNGLLGKYGLHVPSFTVKEYPQFSIWYGLAGEENRQLLAEVFKFPTTWHDYCTQVSTTNCSIPDNVATRFPNKNEEENVDELDMYFHEDDYTGYFRYTDANNCTLNPTTCIGHVLQTPCTYTSRLEQQLYWNNIVGLLDMKKGIEVTPYSYSQMMQVMYAAQKTRSHIIGIWWQLDTLAEEFVSTDFELQYILFPSPSRTCQQHRVSVEDKCNAKNFTARIGTKEGACGDDILPLQRLFSTSIREVTYRVSDVDQSPALEFLKNFHLENLDLKRIMELWLHPNRNEDGTVNIGDGVIFDDGGDGTLFNDGSGNSTTSPRSTNIVSDKYGNDARTAICTWVASNLERIYDSIPPGYPRRVVENSNYQASYLYAAQTYAAIVGVLAALSLFFCWKYRLTKTMVFAQPGFLYLILIGFIMISIGGGILYPVYPSELRCTFSAWLLTLGYTIELVPVLVKTSAINLLIRSSRKQKRVNISRRVMLLKVFVVSVIVALYMVAWTLLDPPKETETRTLSETHADLIFHDVRCSSQSEIWRHVAFAWLALLLMMSALLAYQSRDVMEQLNESKSLAVMVYSHFLFVIFRSVCTALYITNTYSYAQIAAVFSVIFSTDALLAMAIYVWPKIYLARKDPDDFRLGMMKGRASGVNRNSSIAQSRRTDSLVSSDGGVGSHCRLNILTCTANMGNAEPTDESLKAWIPPNGDMSLLKPLDSRHMPEGTFDVIVIGMQEATWKEKLFKKSFVSEKLSEDEVLNAMEEKNTAQLREMVHTILGDDYSQISDEQRGQMRLQIWASDRVVSDITDIRISGANTGIGNVLANKGGIVMTIKYQDTRISFLSAHLAAHEGENYYKNRCDNIKAILREAKTFGLSSKIDVATSSHHMFFMGDLNFRTKFGQEGSHEDNVKRAMTMIDDKNYADLYSYDELQKGLDHGDMLVGFETLPCDFPPTFKVERQDDFVYKDQRTPSYTDRILFKSAEGLGRNLRPLAYEPCVDFITSDHKPIRGAFSILPNALMAEEVKIEGSYQLTITNMRCRGLPPADSDGSSDPYLMFMWDSDHLESSTESFVDKIRRKFLGRSWPRTAYISKTLNPDWEDEEIELVMSDCTVGSDQMLFVAVIDYDAVGKDECLGVLALNLKKIVDIPKKRAQKVIDIDRDLLMEGKRAGKIEFTITATREVSAPSLREKFRRMSVSVSHGMVSSRMSKELTQPTPQD